MTIDGVARNAYQELEQVLLERHAKYGAGNIAAAPGGALNGLRVRMHDKLARLSNYVDNGGKADFADDKLRDAFIDLANYAVIGLLVLDGNWPSVDSGKPFKPRVFRSPRGARWIEQPDGTFDCADNKEGEHCEHPLSAFMDDPKYYIEVTDAN